MILERVNALRQLMEKHQVDAYIIPSTDPHGSEYLPDVWSRRAFISNFTGSAGDVVVTKTKACLWTDSRYFIQAEEQLDPKVFTLFKMALPDTPTLEDWLVQEFQSKEKIGVDPRLMINENYKKLSEKLKKGGAKLVSIEENLVDPIWEDQPPMPSAPVRPHKLQYAGEGVKEKLARVREKMAEEKADAHLVSMLDAIAWLFNMRGSDVSYNPVSIAYAIITMDQAFLFMDQNKVTEELRAHLGSEATLMPYEAFQDRLDELNAQKKRVWADGGSCTRWMVEHLSPNANLLFKPSPIAQFKAVKNQVEIQGARSAHLRDGAALVRTLIWIQENIPSGAVTELKVAAKLEEFRAQGELFMGPSFTSIVGWREHGAIVHYSATEESDATISGDGVLLIDSGGQYLDGTTDVTRTLVFGQPTEEQKDRFTRVLKGHIRLSKQTFPKGVDGVRLDTLARMFLWETGLDFGHGIGHGVGSYLCVHEFPPAISFARGKDIRPEPGMMVTNEPGYYKEGEYGFRQENLAVFVEAKGLANRDTPFYGMETLTMAPIDLALVEKSLLCEDELLWLNQYHKTVYESLSPMLDDKEKTWLKDATRPL